MDLSSKRAPENGTSPIESVSVMQSHVRILNAYDLVKVGLSSTFALAVFFGIGYVVKHVAGPSAILSVMLAAFIAYLVGKIETFSSVVHFFHAFSNARNIFNSVWQKKCRIDIICTIVVGIFNRKVISI